LQRRSEGAARVDGRSEAAHGHNKFFRPHSILFFIENHQKSLRILLLPLNVTLTVTGAMQRGTGKVSGKLHGQMEVLGEYVKQLSVVSGRVGLQHAGREAQLEEKQQRKVRMDAKADNYVEELSKLQCKLEKLGFKPEVAPTQA